MKVIVLGGTGTVGKPIVNELAKRHEVIVGGMHHGDIQVDMTDINSVKAMYEQIKNIDAVVVASGNVHFAELTQMTAKDYQLGLNNKLMGQVNIVIEGIKHLNDGGSFTLTSGILSHDPIRYGSSAAMVNGAIDGFVTGAAIEMPRGIRINSVSPTVLLESKEAYDGYFRGFVHVPGDIVALAYSKSVEGLQTGRVYHVG